MEPGISRLASTPPLASAASLAPQQNFQQSYQGAHQQSNQGAYQPSQGSYQGSGYQQPSQGSFQQPHEGLYQQSSQFNGHQGPYQAQQGPYQAQQGPYQAQSQPAYNQPPSQARQPSQPILGPRTPNTSAEDPFAHLPYPVSSIVLEQCETRDKPSISHGNRAISMPGDLRTSLMPCTPVSAPAPFCLFLILQANIEHHQVSRLEGDSAMPLQCM